jgi:poly(hydroxyalkanoate) depolymerase family esterase
MKLNEDFLKSMHEVMARLRTSGPVEATEAIQRALRENNGGDVFAQPWVSPHGFDAPVTEPAARAPQKAPADVEDRGHFSTHNYSNEAGRRQYKLYVPAGDPGEPLPLIVMLHGCTQDADDFAAGTQMNAMAERHRCIVAYPVQPQNANPSKCWNWFKPGDQQHGRGEPSLIAGITREIMADHPVDPARVYIAGLSAGGAMAAIMIRAYPELYAAAGVHSGLPDRCAHDLPSALAAMKGGRRAKAGRATGGHPLHDTSPSAEAPKRPLIVFHGDADATVHVSNAPRVLHGFELPAQVDSETGTHRNDPGRRASSVERRRSSDGIEAELWTIRGASHAWSGGSARGSYTDPAGPDASAEMMRFFLAHPLRH